MPLKNDEEIINDPTDLSKFAEFDSKFKNFSNSFEIEKFQFLF